MSIIVLATFFNLISIEERLSLIGTRQIILEEVLEARRFEKNYFLFRKQDDFLETISYIDRANILVEENKETLDSLSISYLELVFSFLGFQKSGPGSPSKTSSQLTSLLSEYKILLKKDFDMPRPSADIETSIRRTGKEITDIVEVLAHVEQTNTRKLLTFIRKGLVVALFVFLIIGLIMARFISAIATRPLNRLEEQMKKIASGDFVALPAKPKDKEIQAINDAFNRMTKELFEQRQEIINAEKMASLGTMVAGIAHEVNNPLSNISTSAEILSEEIEGNDLKFKNELIEQIIGETDRARDIIKTLLEFSRDRRLEKRRISLSDTVNHTLLFVRGYLPPFISIDIDVPSDIMIYADRQRLQQAFINLFRNSIDAIKDTGVQGAITLTAHINEDNTVGIEFSDTGKGIPTPLVDKIFDPFFSTKEFGKGTGLGLYITHQIIAQHNGQISVKSELNRGTTFYILIPSEVEDNGK
ncbi:MAG: HAMP domain-containing histidine kinase [Nitrospirota bacterium]|nr:MAG: HAMP domain-containing histidine kinase [Nitrospirota bacterium]